MASLIADPAAQRLRDQNPSFRAIPSHYYVLHLSPLSLPPPLAFDRGHWSPQVHRFQPVKPPLREVASCNCYSGVCISNFTRRDRPFRLLSAPALSRERPLDGELRKRTLCQASSTQVSIRYGYHLRSDLRFGISDKGCFSYFKGTRPTQQSSKRMITSFFDDKPGQPTSDSALNQGDESSNHR
ncbi:hypothetical protein BJY00DRAFT_180137 [Aspergillus carlsbadensis]|nr:hypothetical protein BJY00DRAFT_180137 [Aspergillus carlsbadensis]